MVIKSATPAKPPVTRPRAAKARAGKAAPLFERVTGARPADEIHRQIRALLQAQRLVAGDRLPPERELSEQFGVSRNSVRQALRSMADSGLLEIKKGAAGGAFVSDGGGMAVRSVLTDLYTLGTIQPEHLTEVRLMVGVEVVRLACERGTDEDLDTLETNVRLATQAAKDENFPLRTTLNLDFYRLLAKMTRNPLLEILTDAVMAITLQFVNEFMRTSNVSVMPFRRRLLEDLRGRDSEAAVQHMREHLLKLQKIYLAEVENRRRTHGMHRAEPVR